MGFTIRNVCVTERAAGVGEAVTLPGHLHPREYISIYFN